MILRISCPRGRIRTCCLFYLQDEDGDGESDKGATPGDSDYEDMILKNEVLMTKWENNSWISISMLNRYSASEAEASDATRL